MPSSCPRSLLCSLQSYGFQITARVYILHSTSDGMKRHCKYISVLLQNPNDSAAFFFLVEPHANHPSIALKKQIVLIVFEFRVWVYCCDKVVYTPPVHHDHLKPRLGLPLKFQICVRLGLKERKGSMRSSSTKFHLWTINSGPSISKRFQVFSPCASYVTKPGKKTEYKITDIMVLVRPHSSVFLSVTRTLNPIYSKRNQKVVCGPLQFHR